METKASKSKLGMLCLILAIVVILFVDLRILLILGFFYYAYKLLYKKETASRIDRIIIIILIGLLILEVILGTYYLMSSISTPQVSQALTQS